MAEALELKPRIGDEAIHKFRPNTKRTVVFFDADTKKVGLLTPNGFLVEAPAHHYLYRRN